MEIITKRFNPDKQEQTVPTKQEIASLVLQAVGSERKGPLTEPDIEKARRFHREVGEVFGYHNHNSHDSRTLVVTHMRKSRPDIFLYPLGEVVSVNGFIPKTASVEEEVVKQAEEGMVEGYYAGLTDVFPKQQAIRWSREDTRKVDTILPIFQQIAERARVTAFSRN